MAASLFRYVWHLLVVLTAVLAVTNAADNPLCNFRFHSEQLVLPLESLARAYGQRAAMAGILAAHAEQIPSERVAAACGETKPRVGEAGPAGSVGCGWSHDLEAFNVFLAAKHEHMQLVPFAGCHFGNTDTCSDISWFHRSSGFVWVSMLSRD
ncbi:hypothetical protein SPI_05351 [Niveomyces insectorum RCEF 264]|uniref:Uncharacterized protein n=1 Tax=Niveomyces insectorum RCEF 264 TaxID=1081102 RepID=A0A167T4L6_9HYPO|nr:hypothetical protein SPI_05351 [Niveomyces insectorum RCEF 264]